MRRARKIFLKKFSSEAFAASQEGCSERLIHKAHKRCQNHL
jgi:hypothetical protein